MVRWVVLRKLVEVTSYIPDGVIDFDEYKGLFAAAHSTNSRTRSACIAAAVTRTFRRDPSMRSLSSYQPPNGQRKTKACNHRWYW